MKIQVGQEKGYVAMQAESKEESYSLSWHIGIQREGNWTWFVPLEQRVSTLVQR